MIDLILILYIGLMSTLSFLRSPHTGSWSYDLYLRSSGTRLPWSRLGVFRGHLGIPHHPRATTSSFIQRRQ